jgi:hypothetical protein
MEKWVWEDIRLDNEGDLARYLLTYQYFKVADHRVVFYITHYGEVGFSVDGAVTWGDINPWIGAKILIRLKKLWPEMVKKAKGKELSLYCWPVEEDEAYSRRVRAFSKVGFSAPNGEGMMTFAG